MAWVNLPSKAIEKIAKHAASKMSEETYDENQRLLTLDKLSKVCRHWNESIKNSTETLADDRVIECNEFPETAMKLVKLGKGVHIISSFGFGFRTISIIEKSFWTSQNRLPA